MRAIASVAILMSLSSSAVLLVAGCGAVTDEETSSVTPAPALGKASAGQLDDGTPCDGYCDGSSFCTLGPDAVCYSPDSPISRDRCGCGFCEGRSWCTCEPGGVCYGPDEPPSRDHCTAFAACASDPDCPTGFVCEPINGDCTNPRCIPGCRQGGTPCSCGKTCHQPFCKTCPCPGECF